MHLSRREFIAATGALTLLPLAGCPIRKKAASLVVNDIHSQLNETTVNRIAIPDTLTGVQQAIEAAHHDNMSIAIAGARHSMGGQQFVSGGMLIDTTKLNRVLSFDAARGIVEVESGIEWPDLVDYLVKEQADKAKPWGIAQKQTGADRLTLGGALGSNIHGRGLHMKPLIDNIESFLLLDSNGQLKTCDRRQNSELFKLAIGGYGLFGFVYSIKLRLVPRQKIRRDVLIITTDKLMHWFDKRIEAGYLYGDFQYVTDETSSDYMRKGVFSCYKPVPMSTPVPDKQKQVSERAWKELVYLAHTDKARAYQLYADYYLSTRGQIYWSDTHQLGAYLKDYHQSVDKRMGAANPSTEIITEIYIPRDQLLSFMEEARTDFIKYKVDVIYGTIRLIEKDTESFLAWARQSYACVIFNIHTVHTAEGKEHSAAALRRLIDMAIRRHGSYYLTYHRYATKQQVLACYPQFASFLHLKRHYDPEERFQSNWYRHYKKMFSV